MTDPRGGSDPPPLRALDGPVPYRREELRYYPGGWPTPAAVYRVETAGAGLGRKPGGKHLSANHNLEFTAERTQWYIREYTKRAPPTPTAPL